MSAFQTDVALLGRILYALLLGGVIGLERGLARKSAGMRTHMLVCAGSALIVALSDLTLATHGDAALLRGDPTRGIHAVATGVGFLGAGLMFVATDRVRGLTTAATVWATSAVGIAAGLSRWTLAAGTAALYVLVLRGFAGVERALERRLNMKRPGPTDPA